MTVTTAQLRKLTRALHRNGRSIEDAEDLVQEAFLRVQCYQGEIQDLDAVVYVTARRIATTHWRRSQLVSYVELSEALADRAPTPEQVAVTADELRDVQARLDAHSVKTRRVYLAHRAGYDYDEISRELGLSRRTVEKHICRAVHLLAREGAVR